MYCRNLIYDLMQDRLPEAIDVVLAWNLPDELLPDAVRVQASLLAGMQPEDIEVLPSAAYRH